MDELVCEGQVLGGAWQMLEASSGGLNGEQGSIDMARQCQALGRGLWEGGWCSGKLLGKGFKWDLAAGR